MPDKQETARSEKVAEQQDVDTQREAARAQLDRLGGITPGTRVATPRAASKAAETDAEHVDARYLVDDAAAFGARPWEIAGALHLAGKQRASREEVPALLETFRRAPVEG